METVVGDWYVEVSGRQRHFWVSYANTFEEPVGGLMNVILTGGGSTLLHERLILVLSHENVILADGTEGFEHGVRPVPIDRIQALCRGCIGEFTGNLAA